MTEADFSGFIVEILRNGLRLLPRSFEMVLKFCLILDRRFLFLVLPV